MADDSFSLSGDFDDATEAQWLTAVGKALKGRGIEAITRETLDGIKIHPLYRETNFHAASNPLGMPGAAPFLRGPESTPNSDRPWDIRQAFTHASPEQTHHEIMRDLELFLADNCQAWTLEEDGSYTRLTPGSNEPVSAQTEFLKLLAVAD